MLEHDEQERELIERIAAVARTPESLAPDFMARLMARVRAEARGAGRSQAAPAAPWWRRRFTLRLSLSPAGALAAAAGLAVIVFAGSAARRALAPHRMAAAVEAARTDTVHVVRFVFLAPSASSVALVGDFNNWQRGATRLRQVDGTGAWVATVPIRPGLHQYAFIVDGTHWTPDPAAGTTVTDDFGTTTSLLSIGS